MYKIHQRGSPKTPPKPEEKKNPGKLLHPTKELGENQKGTNNKQEERPHPEADPQRQKHHITRKPAKTKSTRRIPRSQAGR